MTVSGTVHSIDQEEIVADGDTVTLRANNNLPLATGQVSGIVVNKYNGTDDLAIVTDNEGTVRVGTGKGTDTTYTNIALNHSDGKYYTYENNTYTLLDPQPNGNMTSWTGKDVVGGYTHYATAVFTVIEKTSLQPLLTREEESDLTDGAVLVWDAEKTKAIGTAPTNSMQTLVSKIVDGKISYEWGSAVDVVQDGNMHAVTSNAVASALENKRTINPATNIDFSITNNNEVNFYKLPLDTISIEGVKSALITYGFSAIPSGTSIIEFMGADNHNFTVILSHSGASYFGGIVITYYFSPTYIRYNNGTWN